jgi:hypothetical protein
VHTPWGGTLFRAVLEQGLFRREPGVLFKTKFKTKFYLPFRLLLTMSILHVISSIPLSWHIRLSNVMHVCVFVCVCVCVCVHIRCQMSFKFNIPLSCHIRLSHTQ